MRGVEQIPWLYDLYMGLFERSGLLLWRRWLVGKIRGRTLEIGCGTGRNLALIGEGRRVVGLELDLRMLRRARQRAQGKPLVAASAEFLPFRAASFETVVSSLVFCSVDDPDRGLREVRRVIADSGSLRMIEHVRSSRSWVGKLQDLGQPLWTKIAGGCRPNRDTERSVVAAGFRIERAGRRAKNSMRRFSARPIGYDEAVELPVVDNRT